MKHNRKPRLSVLDLPSEQREVIFDRLVLNTKKIGECLVCKRSRNALGYGVLNISPTIKLLAHRAAFELTNGRIGVGLVVMHSCDNPSCCNPTHLKAGTQEENLKDMGAKGRSQHGEAHYMAKLTEDQCKQIISRRLAGEALESISSEFGIHRYGIRRLVIGTRWRHIDRSRL